MTNEKLNKRNRDDAIGCDETSYYKRVGSCDPGKCGSACCRFIVSPFEDWQATKYHKTVTWWIKNPIKTFKHYGKTMMVSSFHCPNITTNGKCKLHNKKEQSATCDMFPMTPDDSVHYYLKEFCGYKFIKTRITGKE